MKDSKKQKEKRILEKITPLFPTPSDTDPFGMYTGVPENKFDVPVQDADDL